MTIRRVLSIDGVGIKGMFPAAVLATLESVLGRPIADYFDLIVGTSSAAITAIGLGLGLTANTLLRFYEERGAVIFCGSRLSRGLRQIGLIKFDPAELGTALEPMFAGRKLGHSKKRLVIPSSNLQTGQVQVWKTSHDPRFQRDYTMGAVDVALSAAAQGDFPAGSAAAVDGGLWASNPVGIAVVEATGVLHWPKETLRVLSIGCTVSAADGGSGHGRFGWLSRRARLIDVLMTTQSSGSLGIAWHLLGDPNNLVRIAPSFGSTATPDTLKDIPALKALGYAEARRMAEKLRPVFFDQVAEPFKPFHTL